MWRMSGIVSMPPVWWRCANEVLAYCRRIDLDWHADRYRVSCGGIVMNECQHERITIVTKYYGGTYYEPPETEILLCQCKDCGEEIDYSDRAKDADVDEVDYKDWY